MTKIISEIGWNHMGDMERAKDMISSSKENGADFVKFQTWSVKRLKNGPWDEDGRLEIYNEAELTKDQHFELYEHSNKVGIDFFSSVFSVEDAKLLSEVQDKFVKIASFDSDNLDLLGYCNDNFETMFISTGTKTVDEVKNSVNKENIPDANVVVLHCISSYPLEPKNANLPRINSLSDLSKSVGFSVEKHFTLDQSLPGRDNKFAILPHELKDLSDYIKMREESKTSHGDGYLEVEEESRKWMTGRFNG